MSTTYRPDLGIGRQREGRAANGEHQVRELGEVRARDLEETGGVIECGAGCALVLLERI